MKRLVLEFPYQEFWRTIFGSNAEAVEVVEAIKSFKCDREGFALICKVRFLDKSMKISDLKKGAIKEVEILYTDSGGSEVIFVAGAFPKRSQPKRPRPAKVFMAGSPEFTDLNKMKVSVVGEEKEVQRYLRFVGKSKFAPKVVSLTLLEPQSESTISRLATKQRQALLTAYGLGYYEVPRKASSEEIARLLKIDKSTFAEHLRKAEKNIIKNVLAE